MSLSECKFLVFFLLSLCLLGCEDQSLIPDSAVESEREEVEDYAWRMIEDEERVDLYIKVDQNIFCGDFSPAIKPMEDVHIRSFTVWPGSDYARDSLNVYYPIEKVTLAAGDITIVHCRRYVVEGVENPMNFRYLGYGYGTDNSNLFYRGEIVENY